MAPIDRGKAMRFIEKGPDASEPEKTVPTYTGYDVYLGVEVYRPGLGRLLRGLAERKLKNVSSATSDNASQLSPTPFSGVKPMNGAGTRPMFASLGTWVVVGRHLLAEAACPCCLGFQNALLEAQTEAGARRARRFGGLRLVCRPVPRIWAIHRPSRR